MAANGTPPNHLYLASITTPTAPPPRIFYRSKGRNGRTRYVAIHRSGNSQTRNNGMTHDPPRKGNDKICKNGKWKIHYTFVSKNPTPHRTISSNALSRMSRTIKKKKSHLRRTRSNNKPKNTTPIDLSSTQRRHSKGGMPL